MCGLAATTELLTAMFSLCATRESTLYSWNQGTNGCQINLDGNNYGNHGTLNAYYFTDANNNMDYPTFEWVSNS